MFVIPAIDIIEGKCVRLTKGDYNQKKVYGEDPLELALQFEAIGLTRLHLVDLDGAKAGQIINYRVLERLATKTTLHIDFGGGLKSDADLKIAFESGAQQVTGGTVAVKNPDVFLNWLSVYGADKIILGADARDEKIATHGWLETSELHLFDFLDNYSQKGITHAICTDISRDGMLTGSSVELYARIRERLPDLRLIASGGVSSVAELQALQELGCYGAIVGKAIYEGFISMEDLKQYISKQ